MGGRRAVGLRGGGRYHCPLQCAPERPNCPRAYGPLPPNGLLRSEIQGVPPGVPPAQARPGLSMRAHPASRRIGSRSFSRRRSNRAVKRPSRYERGGHKGSTHRSRGGTTPPTQKNTAGTPGEVGGPDLNETGCLKSKGFVCFAVVYHFEEEKKPDSQKKLIFSSSLLSNKNLIGSPSLFSHFG